MDKHTETLKFRTKWLHHTVEVLKTTCKNYHHDTCERINQLNAKKDSVPAYK